MRSVGARVKGQGVRVAGILCALCLILTVNAWAENVTSKQLIQNAKDYDGTKVSYAGEVVTAVLNRGTYAWINVNDGDNAIGVFCKADLVKDIKFVGSYRNKGDIVEVEGRFNRACSMHGGELDIHAMDVKVIKSGYRVKEHVDKKKLVASCVLFVLIIVVSIVFRKRL